VTRVKPWDMVPYKVGDVILADLRGNPGALLVVEEKVEDIRQGRAGFRGLLLRAKLTYSHPVYVWGYDVNVRGVDEEEDGCGTL